VGRGTTVYERWRERRRLASADTEELYLNPLDARVGDVVTLDHPDFQDLDFQVRQFRVLTREIGEREFPITDYYLLHRGLTNDDTVYRLLRYIPLDEPDPDAGRTHTVLLLNPVDECEHNQQIMDELAANQGYTFEMLFDDNVAEEILFPSRVNDIQLPYECSVDIIKDADHDGEVEPEEVESHRLTYWDFWRCTSEEEDAPVEYLFVEVDQEDGWTEFFIGEEIDQETITKL
jgi:hypothetical protein